MNDLHLSTARRSVVVAFAAFLTVLCSQQFLTAAPPGEGFRQQKVVVGQTVGLPPGFLFHRDGETWKHLLPLTDIYSDDLIVALPYGGINSKNKNVRLTLLSDLARISPYPILESAVILHQTDLDLDFMLDRGRVDVTNTRRSGESKIRVRFQKQVWDLTLGNKARVAFELFGRWPAGSPFSKTPKPNEGPTLDLVMLVKEGEVDLKADGREFAMKAPPGAAYLHWDSVPPFDETPRLLESLPAWSKLVVNIPNNPGDLVALLSAFRTRLRDRNLTVEETISGLLNEDNATAHRIAVYALGGLDDLPHLIDALSSSKYPEVRDLSVIALRHWIGRSEGQDQKLYEALLKKGYSEKQATMVMNLLHSFSDRQKASPATYERLIELLLDENPAVRQLANWHLNRLVTKGKDIKFDPLASPEERQKASEKWKELIPAGKLPPR